jgi:hypothetical protein
LFGAKGQAMLLLSPESSLDKEKDIFEKGKADIFEIESVNVGKVRTPDVFYFFT